MKNFLTTEFLSRMNSNDFNELVSRLRLTDEGVSYWKAEGYFRIEAKHVEPNQRFDEDISGKRRSFAMDELYDHHTDLDLRFDDFSMCLHPDSEAYDSIDMIAVYQNYLDFMREKFGLEYCFEFVKAQILRKSEALGLLKKLPERRYTDEEISRMESTTATRHKKNQNTDKLAHKEFYNMFETDRYFASRLDRKDARRYFRGVISAVNETLIEQGSNIELWGEYFAEVIYRSAEATSYEEIQPIAELIIEEERSRQERREAKLASVKLESITARKKKKKKDVVDKDFQEMLDFIAKYIH